MPDKTDAPLATDVLLGQLDDALSRVASDLDVLAYDIITVGIPDLSTMNIVPCAQVMIVARGYDLSGPGAVITGWNALKGFWVEQADVDEITRTVAERIRESRRRQQADAMAKANGELGA